MTINGLPGDAHCKSITPKLKSSTGETKVTNWPRQFMVRFRPEGRNSHCPERTEASEGPKTQKSYGNRFFGKFPSR